MLRFAAAGLLGMIGYNLPVTVGLQWLPASSAGLLLATEPVWVLVISYVFLGERAGPRVLLGSGVALAGVAVIAGPSALSSGYGMRAVAGAALVLLATMAFGGISRLLYLEPVVSVLGAMVFLGERATAAVLIGGVLVIAGVLMTVGSGHSGRRPAPVST